ncbi:MAG: T9SS type A sorting domain-containing protein [Chitinophagaceae bacterium]|nr:T9SS type A sorting domain-containing protein [Chitinophagaceae bacterium]
MAFKVDNTSPLNVHIGYWDGILYCWGQNFNNYPTVGFGDLFYGRFAWNSTSTFKTYHNPYFEFLTSTKGTYWSNPGDNFFPFCGGYEPADPNQAGYVNGKLGYNTNPEEMIENSKYHLNVDYFQPNYHVGIDKYTSSGKISGIANRVGNTADKFYYFYENDEICSDPILFDEDDKVFESNVDNSFRVSEMPLTITSFSIEVSNGPTLSAEDICFDTYLIKNGVAQNHYSDLSYLRPELPININSWENNDYQDKLISVITKPQSIVLPQSKLYPNPTSDKILLESGKEMINMFQIIDSKGKIIVAKSNINKTSISIDMRNFSKGIYFVRYSISGAIKSEKIIYQ